MKFLCSVWIQSEIEQMKERFAKLLLGEDMSGGGKGVSSALALSNAITNLAGTLLAYRSFVISAFVELCSHLDVGKEIKFVTRNRFQCKS